MWTPEDIRVASLLEAQFPNVHVVDVIHHEEIRMTEPVQPDMEAEGYEDGETAFGGATYPEYPYSLADHVYTWSPKLPDGSMLVIRSQTADGLVEAVENMGPLAGRLRAAWAAVVGQPQAPQFQTPQTPPPFGANVSVPAAPGYVGPPVQQQAPQWGAPQQNGFGGGGQQAQRKEYPAPQGWYRLNVPYPGGKDQLHALAQSAGIPKGNPSKGGAYNFFGLAPSGQPGKAWYCSPQAAPAFAQFNPMPA